MATATTPREGDRGASGAPGWGASPGAYRDSWPTPLQSDLLRAALLRDERGLASWRRIRPALTVADMDSAVQALLPTLRTNLRSLGVDDPLLELFKGVHRHAWARNQLMLAQVMPAVAELERAGVPTLMLKGAALLADRRHNAGIREMTDIDVLVPTDALAQACQVLADRGMRPVEGVPVWYVTDYWAPRVRHSANFADSAGGQLDLHWHALLLSRQANADRDFWAASQPAALSGVSTRTLCAADELLLVIVHGLLWSPTPTYRWVLDATLIARDPAAALDYDRLCNQARRRRVAPALAAGLHYLDGVAGVEVPARVWRDLRAAAPLQRRELRVYTKRPTCRSAVDQAVYLHGQYLRERLGVGDRATPARQLRLAAERLGISRLVDLRELRPGGCPGPGRPQADTMAPIGTGSCSPPAVAWGTSLDFGDQDTARQHCLYGLWLAEEWGSWIAGREAGLALELPERPDSSLLLQVWAGGHLAGSRRRAQLKVLVAGKRLAELAFDADRPRIDAEGIALPRAVVAGRSRIELVLRTPAPCSPARLGTVEDTRRFGAYLARLAVRPARRCAIGEPLPLGVDSGDEEMLAGGWAGPDPGARWTYGAVAQMLLAPVGRPTVLEWCAEAFVPHGAKPMRIEVSANGIRLGTVDYADPATRRSQLSLGAAATAADLKLAWRIREPRSPSQLGLSDDRRPLGLLFRSVTLH